MSHTRVTDVGRWKPEEHEIFLQGYRKYGRVWTQIQQLLPKRSVLQIRTHAQKYFLKTLKEGSVSNDTASSSVCPKSPLAVISTIKRPARTSISRSTSETEVSQNSSGSFSDVDLERLDLQTHPTDCARELGSSPPALSRITGRKRGSSWKEEEDITLGQGRQGLEYPPPVVWPDLHDESALGQQGPSYPPRTFLPDQLRCLSPLGPAMSSSLWRTPGLPKNVCHSEAERPRTASNISTISVSSTCYDPAHLLAPPSSPLCFPAPNHLFPVELSDSLVPAPPSLLPTFPLLPRPVSPTPVADWPVVAKALVELPCGKK